MAAIGTALGAKASSSGLFSWPPSEDAVNKHGPLALLGVMSACAATLAASVLTREESHTPEILKVRSRAEVLKSRSGRSLDTIGEKAEGSKDVSPSAKAEIKEEDKEWHEVEMAIRKPKLLHLMDLASKSLEAGEKSKVKFKEMFEACIDVRHLDYRDPDLGKAFDVCVSLLIAELVKDTKLTQEGKAPYHKTGEDLANLVSRYSAIHAMCRGLSMSKADNAKLWIKVRQLWWQSWHSQLVLWKMRIPDVIKACKVVLLAKRYLPLLVVASGLRVASNSVGALETLFRAEALETFRRKGFAMSEVMSKMRASILFAGAKMLLQLAGDRLNLSALLRMSHKLRTEVYSAMLRQDLEWYRFGQQDQRDIHGLFGEIFALPTLTGTFVNAITRTGEALTTGVAMGTLIRQRSTGFMITMVAVEFGVNVGKTALGMASTWLKAVMTRTMTKVEQNWGEPLMPENVSTVRANAAEGKVLQNWNMYWRSEHEQHLQRDLVEKLRMPVDSLMTSVSWGTEIRTAAGLVQDGRIPFVADVQSLAELATKMGSTVWEAAWAVSYIKDSIPKLARTYEVIFSKPTIGLEGGIMPDYPRTKGRLEFRDVTFAYPETSDVVKKVSFDVPVQHTCGITGSSGAGKSTLLLLMQRLYDPQEGEILLDGMDIRTLNPIWVRRQIAVVSQRPRIFHMSLQKNLSYGCEMEPTDKEVEEACKAACMHDLIFQNPVRFPLGLHTRVSNETLSGGELQRVAIARALLKDSPVLLLDEATSALDSESQSQVKEGLKNLMRGRTVIIVAHRLETIKDADSILCIEEGYVKERGTHKELVQAGGLYSRLYREQIESTISNNSPVFDATDPVKALEAVAADS